MTDRPSSQCRRRRYDLAPAVRFLLPQEISRQARHTPGYLFLDAATAMLDTCFVSLNSSTGAVAVWPQQQQTMPVDSVFPLETMVMAGAHAPQAAHQTHLDSRSGNLPLYLLYQPSPEISAQPAQEISDIQGKNSGGQRRKGRACIKWQREW